MNWWRGGEGKGEQNTNAFDAELTAIDAVLARSAAAIGDEHPLFEQARSRAPGGRTLPENHPRRSAPALRPETRLLAIAEGFLAAVEIELKEHDRLTVWLARTLMERKLAGQRALRNWQRLSSL